MGKTRRLDEAEVASQAWRFPHVMESNYEMFTQCCTHQSSLFEPRLCNDEDRSAWDTEVYRMARTSVMFEGDSTRFARLVFEYLPSLRYLSKTQKHNK